VPQETGQNFMKVNEQFPEKMCHMVSKYQYAGQCPANNLDALAHRQFAGQCPANCLARSNMMDIIREVCDQFVQNDL